MIVRIKVQTLERVMGEGGGIDVTLKCVYMWCKNARGKKKCDTVGVGIR